MTARAALAKVHIAKKELGIEDGAYRALLERLTGQTSSKDCTDAQLGIVLHEMKAKGWTPKFKVAAGNAAAPARRGAPASSPMARKARSIWISLHQLGAIRNPSEAALEAFGRRQLGVEKLQWANQSQAYRLIEALKAMAGREGWSHALDKTDEGREVRTLKERLYVAQERKLSTVAMTYDTDLVTLVGFSDAELDAAIAAYGRLINRAAGAE